MNGFDFVEGFNNMCIIIKVLYGEYLKKKFCYCILNLYYFKEYVIVRKNMCECKNKYG